VILKFLVAGWKFVMIGFVALGAFIKNLFTRKKKDKMIDTEAIETPHAEVAPVLEPVVETSAENQSSGPDDHPTTPVA
jgi:hypothetical protein